MNINEMAELHWILRLLIDQFNILETMTPFDFYDFRCVKTNKQTPEHKYNK